jgi:hypothetical protein
MERAAAAGAEGLNPAGDQALSKAAARAGRRRLAAQSSLFDLANQKVVDKLREADLTRLSPEEAKQLVSDLKRDLI